MRRLIAIAAAAFTMVALPAIATAGAVHFVDTWTDAPTQWLGPDECTGKVLTGTGIESGTAEIVETPNGGFHVRVEGHGTVDLYESLGPGPWDPQPGAFVGTWTYEAHVSDGQGATSGVVEGPFVLADGSSVRRQIFFHLTWDKNGPPKVFFVNSVCSGG